MTEHLSIGTPPSVDSLVPPTGPSKEVFPDKHSIIEYLRAFSSRFTDAPSKSLYELLYNANPDFRNNVWNNDGIHALIEMAKSDGVISAKANSDYGDYLRFSIE